MKTLKRIQIPALTLATTLLTTTILSQAQAASVGLQQATATYSQYDATMGWFFSVEKAINGTADDGLAWGISHYTTDLGTQGGTFSETAVFETTADVGLAGGSILTFNLTQLYGGQHTLGRFRLSITTDDRTTFADGLMNGGDVTANWLILNPSSFVSANGTTLHKLGDFSILAGGASPGMETYTITAPTELAGITGFRLEVLEDTSLPFHGPGRNPENGNFKLSEFSVNIAAVPEPQVCLLALMSLPFILGRRLPTNSHT